MRLSPEDRRHLARRLKNRLPAALPQMLLIVSATAFLTPQAFARIDEGTAEVVVTKTYTKDELSQKLPPIPVNPVSSLRDRIAAEVTEIFRSVTSAQGGDVQRAKIEALKTKQADKATWDLAVGRMKDMPSSAKTDAAKMRVYLALEAKKAVSVRAGGYFPNIAKLKGGLDLSTIKSLFGRESSAPVASGNTRYGLILADITPDHNADNRASIGDPEDEMRYAGHADVHWTIGRVDEEQGRRLFAFDEAATSASNTGSDDSLWNRVRVPRLNFNSKLKPESPVTGFSGDAMPIWRLDVTQEDGILNLVYRTTAKGKRVSQEETVNIPVAGNMTIGRRFSDKWDAIQTSACNILFDKRLPLVSVHYMHLEERYKADIAHQFDPSTRIALAAKGQATGAVLEKGETDRPEQYSLEYSKTF